MPAPLFLALFIAFIFAALVSASEKYWGCFVSFTIALVLSIIWLVAGVNASPVIKTTEIVTATHTPSKSYVVYTDGGRPSVATVSGTAKQYKVDIHESMYYGIHFGNWDRVKISPILEGDNE